MPQRSPELNPKEHAAQMLRMKGDAFLGMYLVDGNGGCDFIPADGSADNDQAFVDIVRRGGAYLPVREDSVYTFVGSDPYSGITHQMFPEVLESSPIDIRIGTEVVAKALLADEPQGRSYFIGDSPATAEQYKAFGAALEEMCSRKYKNLEDIIPGHITDAAKRQFQHVCDFALAEYEKHVQMASADETLLVFKDATSAGAYFNDISSDLDVQAFIRRIEARTGSRISRGDGIMGKPEFDFLNILTPKQVVDESGNDVLIFEGGMYFGREKVGNSYIEHRKGVSHSEEFTFGSYSLTRKEHEKLVRVLDERALTAYGKKKWKHRDYADTIQKHCQSVREED